MNAKILFGTLLIFFCAMSFFACDNDDNGGNDNGMLFWDFAPIVLQISVQDAQGNDLLNPEMEGFIGNKGIKAIYRGKTFEKDSVVIPKKIAVTRAYLPHFKGLQTWKNDKGRYFLTFGEFAGDDNFNNEQVKIDWSDGTSDVFSFSNHLQWKSNKEPEITRSFFLNGEKKFDKWGIFNIVK